MNLLSVREARQRILNALQPVSTETLPLMACMGRVLAEDISATTDLPPFDNSSVDGFALRSTDASEANPASPRDLRVVADIPAGSSPQAILGPGEAARIMTGAPLPPGADAVIPVEDTDFKTRAAGTPAPSVVRIFKAVRPGENVRPRGADIRQGQIVLRSGQRLRPQDIGILAMLGAAHVQVYRKPRLALLSSGDELLPVEAPLEMGKIRDANSYTLSALIATAGAEVISLGIAPDERQAIQARLENAVQHNADMIITSAGVSVGAFDYVKEIIESNGTLTFWRVNMRPGKPLAFGSYRGIPYIGLPGNPVSAFVGFEVFVRAAIQRLSGEQVNERPRLRVRLAEEIESDGRESYLRAEMYTASDGTLQARLSEHQGSGNLFSLVRANALLIIPAGVKSLPIGAEVDAWLL
jgi:molybdopterin molybdotransferase